MLEREEPLLTVGQLYVNMMQAEVLSEEGSSVEKMPSPHCPVDKPQGPFLDWWLTWASGANPELVMLDAIRKQAEQAVGHKPVISMHSVFASVPASMFPAWVPALTSLDDELKAIRWNKLYSLGCFWPWYLITAIEKWVVQYGTKQYSLCGKQFRGSSKNLKQSCHITELFQF